MAPCWYSPCWDLEPQNREVLGSNPMVCSWKSCSASAVESDLGVPTPCQVGSTVVLQEKKRKKKKRTTTTTKLRRAGAALLRGAAAEVETRDYKEKQSWSSSHRKSITRECIKIGAGSWSNHERVQQRRVEKGLYFMATKHKNISTDESCRVGLHTASTQFL